MERALLTFTPSLSKRLIAKGVAAMPEVQKAFGEGKVLISTGTTTTFIYGELCGEMPEGPLACGMVTEKGLCVGSGMPVGMIPVTGTVVTECRALECLADVQVFHVASGGVSGAQGAVVLLVTQGGG